MPFPEASIVLDFTEGGVLPPALLQRLDALAVENRASYDELIDTAGKAHVRNLDWWVSLPASRNTHAGALFGKCIQLRLARALMEEGSTFSVRTDDPAQARVLRSAKCSVDLVRRRSPWLRLVRNVTSSVFHALGARFAAFATRRGTRLLPADGTILEIFVQRDSFESGAFRDRYYPGLFESLDESQRARFFYLPIFHRIRDYIGLFRRLRLARQNFLLREDYLTSRDYLYAFGHWLRAGQLKGLRGCFAGFEIGAMLDAELEASRYSNATMQALLTYRFWFRHAPKNCARFVDWYEGHGVDHATAAAIRWHGGRTLLVAMRPIAPDAYLSLTPTAGEIKAEVVARNWAVVGAAPRRMLMEKCPELEIVPAPGLRHRALRDLKRRPPLSGAWTVLIVLSIEDHMVRQVAHLLEQLGDQDCRWRIKPHPAMPRPEAEHLLARVGGDMQIVEGEFAELLSEADAVAGLGTNTLIEAAAVGIPVFCLSSGNMPTELPFSPGAPVFSRVIYDAEGFSAALAEARAASRTADMDEMRNDLLGPFAPEVLKQILFSEASWPSS